MAIANESLKVTYRKLIETRDAGLVIEWRELKIRLNPQYATEGDVVFLLSQLDEARAERQHSNYASAAAIDVEAWLVERRALICDFIGAAERNSDAYKFGTVFGQA